MRYILGHALKVITYLFAQESFSKHNDKHE